MDDEATPGGVAGTLNRALVALRHVVVIGWIAATAAAVWYLPGLGGEGALDLPLPDDAAPLQAERRSAEIFGAPLTSRTQVLVTRPGGLSPSDQAALARFAGRVSAGRDPALRGEIAAAVPLPSARGLAPGAEGGTESVLTYLVFAGPRSVARQTELARAYLDAAPVPPDAQTALTGSSPSRQLQLEAIDDRLPWVVAITLALIVGVVGVTLRSVVAPAIVLGVAGLAYLVDLHVIGWIGERTGLAAVDDVEPVVSALLLGIVTDYAVFYLFGTRDRLRRGLAPRAAAAAAGARTMPVVAVAGLTTALGTATLLVGELDFFRAFAPALAVTALVAATMAVTLLPALLALLGRAAYWPGGVGEDPGAGDPRPAPRRAPLATRVLTRRGVAALTVVAVVAGLGLCASELRNLELGLGLTGGPDPEVTAAEAGFAPGVTAPTELLVEGPGAVDAPVQAAIADQLRAVPGVADVVGPADPLPSLAPELAVAAQAGASRFAIVLDSEPTEAAAIDVVNRIDDELPAILERAGAPGARGALAGDTAIAAASVDAMGRELARVGAAALAVNLLLLALFLRALVAPLYLLVANALTVAATLGIATWFFQSLLDQGQLVYYVPFAAAVLLLALGSDYNIFLVGGIWRAAREHGIVGGIRTASPRASATITVAGLILAGSFGLLALVPVEALRQLAFVMALGIALDALLVRSLLVPALIALFGRAGYWPGRPPAAEREDAPAEPAQTLT